MLDVLKNIDTVNYIIQDCLDILCNEDLSVRNNVYSAEGFGVDIIKSRGTGLSLRIRTDNLQTLCNVMMDKNTITLRYSHKFMIQYNTKTNLVKTTQFEDAFELSEMESTFFVQDTIGFGLAVQADFCFDTMIETIQKSRRLHNAFLSFIQA